MMYKYAYAVYDCAKTGNSSTKSRDNSIFPDSQRSDMGLESPDKAYKEKLIRGVKKEVKQIMEEAVTKKFVHEDSGSITSLCAAVELCVSHGLKRRALGLFKSSSTTALLHKVAKTFQPAATIVQLVIETETCDPNKRSSSGSESAGKLPLSTGIKPPLQKRNSATTKFLWIRLALVEKLLARIIDHIVQTSSKYYEKYALVADPDYGSILSSLLVGPCALDFSRLRTGEHLWTDPPADELVQRHRISSAHSPVPPSPPFHKRPQLHYKRSTVSSNLDDSQVSKDYVESLHQNNKSTLLYGKNNVLMILKEAKQPLAGYLSLHQCGEALNLKWTPNQLMSAVPESHTSEKSIYWEHAMNITLHEIVYLHCHQDANSDWIVLVGQDGVQRPPVHFPRGGHLLAFLSCLENGLLPHGQLDPPLWSQTGKGEEPGSSPTSLSTSGQEELSMLDPDWSGKIFPKLRRKGSRLYRNVEEVSGGNTVCNGQSDEPKSDFVFRIDYHTARTYEQSVEEMLENPLWKAQVTKQHNSAPVTPRSTPLHSASTTSSTSSSKSIDQQNGSALEPEEPIQSVCQTMKKQIISRAFYGWLSHCRHLRTVRTHLVGLVRDVIVKADDQSDVHEGLTEKKWEELRSNGEVDMAELYRVVYFGGMAHNLRRKVWPMMLRGSAAEIDGEALRKDYEDRMAEWLVVEAIVRQRDKEIMAANLAKLSSEGSAGGCENEQLPSSAKCIQSTTYGSNEVFEDNSVHSTPKRKLPGRNESEIETPLRLSVGPKSEINQNGKNGISSVEVMDEQTDEIASSESSDGSTRSSPIGLYSQELLETFGLNIHRIDKDVKRCDRNYWYFIERNLEKLRNVMCTYVWEHLEIGYVQGMCDLVAPLLVILDDEAEAYMCFNLLMDRMCANFPIGGGAMDTHFANMRSLLQVLDHDLFTLIRQNGDYTHFYFCYRWFLLDFKREFLYQDVFLVWETIWAARHVASMDFVLFLALALLNYYRDIILSNSMDFTDIIKFFNEMAERHDAKTILQIARNLVLDLQTLIEDK